MAGLDPATPANTTWAGDASWVPGSSQGMTKVCPAMTANYAAMTAEKVGGHV
jgi:hypothetical protein